MPARGGGLGEPAVAECVVNTILAGIDGLEELQGVVVIGAANRSNLLDPALLCPGRFDELVYVPVPDEAGAPGRQASPALARLALPRLIKAAPPASGHPTLPLHALPPALARGRRPCLPRFGTEFLFSS